MLYRSWQIGRPEESEAAALGVPRLVGGVLRARGVKDQAEAAVLCGEGEPLCGALCLAGMDRAVERIHRAIDAGERIAVFGDYDVDGVTATALLYLYLDSVSADVYYKLPSRDDEGYGLSEAAVDFMASKGVKLIITVDNGVSACEAVRHAREVGLDVVVTDHHLPPPELPDAAAIVDPQLPYDTSPCKMLSGAGVAFYLAAALDGCSPEEMLPFYGDLAAIGAIADIMPLVGQNRRIVRAGLALLQNCERPGLAALIESCGLAGKPLTAENVSFGIAPRLNAAGRMDNATAALELLLCEDPEEAVDLAADLEAKNAARQKTEQDILASVLEDIAADSGYSTDRILVVSGRGYHPGVIGIVASRVVERFGKPAIIISIDETGEGRGSGRSIAGISLYNAIAACAPLLIRFGGHALAAGLSVREEQVPALRRQINAWAAQAYPVIERPALVVDLPVELAALTEEDVGALACLAPFGSGNPAPLFCVENAVIDAVYPLSDGRHSRLRLKQGEGTLYAAYFGRGPQELAYGVGDRVDAAVSLSLFEGKAGPLISARIRDLRPAGLDDAYLAGAGLFEALSCGAPLTETQRAVLHTVREDAVAVYRAIGQTPEGIPADDLRPLFAKLGARNAGKTLVSLQALQELGLAAPVETPHHGTRWRLLPVTGKRDLLSAPIFRRLEGST